MRTNLEMDDINYKQERGVIKARPELKSEITTKLQKHISKKLVGVEFNHKNSQKEDFVID